MADNTRLRDIYGLPADYAWPQDVTSAAYMDVGDVSPEVLAQLTPTELGPALGLSEPKPPPNPLVDILRAGLEYSDMVTPGPVGISKLIPVGRDYSEQPDPFKSYLSSIANIGSKEARGIQQLAESAAKRTPTQALYDVTQGLAPLPLKPVFNAIMPEPPAGTVDPASMWAQGANKVADVFKTAADVAKERGEAPDLRVTTANKLPDVKNARTAAEYVLNTFGSAAGSILPLAATAVATGPYGSVPMLGSLGIGSIRDAFDEAGVDWSKSEDVLYPAAAVYASLEYIPGVSAVKALLKGEAKEAFDKTVLQAVLRGTARGGAREGVTEALQTATEITSSIYAKTRDIGKAIGAAWDDVLKGMDSKIIESGFQGLISGGLFDGGSRGAQRAQQVPQQPPPVVPGQETGQPQGIQAPVPVVPPMVSEVPATGLPTGQPDVDLDQILADDPQLAEWLRSVDQQPAPEVPAMPVEAAQPAPVVRPDPVFDQDAWQEAYRLGTAPAPGEPVVSATVFAERNPAGEPGIKTLSINGETVAAATVNRDTDGNLVITRVDTLPGARRQGYATQLIDDLLTEFPGTRVEASAQTDEGRPFFARYATRDGSLAPRDSQEPMYAVGGRRNVDEEIGQEAPAEWDQAIEQDLRGERARWQEGTRPVRTESDPVEQETRRIMQEAAGFEASLRQRGLPVEAIAAEMSRRYKSPVTPEAIQSRQTWWSMGRDDQKFWTPARSQQLGQLYRERKLGPAEVASILAEDAGRALTPAAVTAQRRNLAIPANKFAWTPERADRLRTVHGTRMKAREIARRLSDEFGVDLTPQAIRHQVSLMGLSRERAATPASEISSLRREGRSVKDIAAGLSRRLGRDVSPSQVARVIAKGSVEPKANPNQEAMLEALGNPDIAALSNPDAAVALSERFDRPISRYTVSRARQQLRRRQDLDQADSEPMYAIGSFRNWFGLGETNGQDQANLGRPGRDGEVGQSVEGRGQEPAGGQPGTQEAVAGRQDGRLGGREGTNARRIPVRGGTAFVAERVRPDGLRERSYYVYSPNTVAMADAGASVDGVPASFLRGSIGNWWSRAKIVEQPDGSWRIDEARTRRDRRGAGLGTDLHRSMEADVGDGLLPQYEMSPDDYRWWRQRDPDAVRGYVKFDDRFYDPGVLQRLKSATERIAATPILQSMTTAEKREIRAAMREAKALEKLKLPDVKPDDEPLSSTSPTMRGQDGEDATVRRIKREIANGRPAQIAQHEVDFAHAVLEPDLSLVPEGTIVATLSRIDPLPERGADAVKATFVNADGKRHTISMSLGRLLDSRALFLNGQRPVILISHIGIDRSKPFDPRKVVLDMDQARVQAVGADEVTQMRLVIADGLRADFRHEVVHLLRSIRAIPDTAWRRLVDHSNSLDLMGLDADLPTSRRMLARELGIAPNRTLGQVYQKMYARYRDPQEAMDQESVAAMVELAWLGSLSDAQLAPVRDVLNEISKGQLTPTSKPTGEPEVLSALARDNQGIPSTPGLDMSREARLERAREMGFDTGKVYYHQTHKENVPSLMRDGFDINRVKARRHDEQMPDGVFLKPNDADISVGATGEDAAQVPAFIRLTNPAVFKDRDHLAGYLRRDAEYDVLADEVNLYDRERAASFDKIWYDDSIKGDDKSPLLDANLAETEAGLTQRAAAARARATQLLKAAGHDGIVVQNDRGGLFGKRSVETTVVFDPPNVRHTDAAFDPSLSDSPQLMAAVGTDRTDAEIGRSMRRDLDNLGFYSKALEAARGLKQEKGTPEQMLAQLKKAGVKDSEIEATGLADLFKEKSGSTTALESDAITLSQNPQQQGDRTASPPRRALLKQISKSEIVRHLEENRVGLREKVYSDEAAKEPYLKLFDALAAKYGTSDPNNLYKKATSDEVDELQRLSREASTGFPKWSRHSLDPSNPTYRETVLHLPSNADRDAAMQQAVTLRQQLTGAIMRGDTATADDLSARLEALDQNAKLRSGNSSLDFTSGHFPEPNIIGHMMTSMVKHEGKPTYLIDQIQSDWGQRLRDDGVRDEAKIASLRQRMEEAKAATQEHMATGPAVLGARIDTNNPTALSSMIMTIRAKASGTIDRAGDPVAFEWRKRHEDLQNKYNMALAELRTAEASAPGHPLVNTTDQWTQTTLRRAIRQAVEAGAEYIAVPSGETVLSYNPGDRSGMRGFYGGKANPAEADAIDAAKHAPEDIEGDRADAASLRKDIEGIVPKNLRKLLSGIDKATPAPARIDQLETPSGMKGEGFTLFPLTDSVRTSVLEDGQPMFAFAGRNAKTADLKALDRAKEMDSQNLSREDIWKETGWFKGVDGEWRFEIDDSGAVIPHPTESAVIEKGGASGSALRAALNHPEFFDAYPAMKQTDWAVAKSAFPQGNYRPPTYDERGFIGAQGPTPQDRKSVMLHEGQHGLQHIEGFATGHHGDAPAWIKGADGQPEWVSPRDAYRRSAGETEARTVQKRMDMKPDERKARPPWLDYDVPEDQQIVSKKGGTALSQDVEPFDGDLPRGISFERNPSDSGGTYYDLYARNWHGKKSRIGHATVRDLGDRVQVGYIGLEPAYQKRGIATAIYGQIERDFGKPLVPDTNLSDFSYSFWMKHRPEAVEGKYEKSEKSGEWLLKDEGGEPRATSRRKAEKAEQSNEPQSIVSIIRSYGGVKGSPDLRQLLGKPGTKGYIPGVINEKRGVSLNQIREALITSGHIVEDQGKPSQIGDNELLEMIEAEITRKPKATLDTAGENDSIINQAVAFYETNGMHYFLTDAEEKRLVDHVRKGMTIDDAIEQVAMETFREVDQEDAEFAERNRKEHRGSAPDHRQDQAGVGAAPDLGRPAGSPADARPAQAEDWIRRLGEALNDDPSVWMARLSRALDPIRPLSSYLESPAYRRMAPPPLPRNGRRS